MNSPNEYEREDQLARDKNHFSVGFRVRFSSVRPGQARLAAIAAGVRWVPFPELLTPRALLAIAQSVAILL